MSQCNLADLTENFKVQAGPSRSLSKVIQKRTRSSPIGAGTAITSWSLAYAANKCLMHMVIVMNVTILHAYGFAGALKHTLNSKRSGYFAADLQVSSDEVNDVTIRLGVWWNLSSSIHSVTASIAILASVESVDTGVCQLICGVRRADTEGGAATSIVGLQLTDIVCDLDLAAVIVVQQSARSEEEERLHIRFTILCSW